MKRFVVFPGILSNEEKRNLMKFLDNCEVIDKDWFVGVKDFVVVDVDSGDEQSYSFSACEVNLPSASWWPDFVEQFRKHYDYGVNLVTLSSDWYLVEEVKS